MPKSIISRPKDSRTQQKCIERKHYHETGYKSVLSGSARSLAYILENITNLYKEIEIAGVCDLIPERAENAVKKYGMKLYRDMYELFADPEVDIVLNITRPAEHFEVSKAALMAGKHVYSEKPLAATLAGGT